MTWIIDVILIAVVVFGIIFGVKKGFVYMLLNFTGVFLAFAVAFFLAQPVADVCYKNFAEKPVTEAVEKFVDNCTDDVNETSNKIFHGSGAISFLALISGVKDTQFKADIINEDVQNNMTKYLMVKIVKPATISLLRMLLMLLMFVLFRFLIKLIAKPIGKLFQNLRIIGKLNGFLGGVLGVLTGILFAALAAGIIYLILVVTGGLFGIKADSVSQTLVVSNVIKLLSR